MTYRIILFLLFIVSGVVRASETKLIALYDVQAPEKQQVTLQYFIPEKQSGTAVIICPGGGYFALCDSYEGEDVANYLNQLGITAILLRYRTGKELNITPLEDALEAVRYVRKNASKYGINPDAIGIMGFSAGGHLASLAAVYGKNDTAVNFQILIYPVISLLDEWTHKGSQVRFLGSLNSDENKRKYSSDLQVTPLTPPAFICHAVTDRTVSVENSRMYVAALKKFNIPVTYLELAKGAHGFGAGKSPEWKIWQDGCKKWLFENKLAR
jgi:acetyl esterase/lipase